jgi:hypothetical protein
VIVNRKLFAGERTRQIVAVCCPFSRIGAIFVAQKAVLTILLFTLPSLFKQPLSSQRFTTWDAAAYLEIAAHGYDSQPVYPFYPLWPACIRLVSKIMCGHAILASYLCANVFSLIGLILFYRLVREKHGFFVANRAALLLLVFPGSLFMFVPYTEALFFCLLMAWWWSMYRKAYWKAAVFGMLLPLTRAIGCFILPVMLWELFRKGARLRTYSWCFAPIIGYAAYFGIMYCYTGNPLSGFDAQQNYPARPSVGRIGDLVGFCHSFMNFGWYHDFLHSFIDRIVFLSFLISLFWILRLDSGYYVYAIFAGLIPALSNSLMSYTRFVCLVFPLFIVWGTICRRNWIFVFLCMLFFAMQIVFLLLHISGSWAG